MDMAEQWELRRLEDGSPRVGVADAILARVATERSTSGSGDGGGEGDGVECDGVGVGRAYHGAGSSCASWADAIDGKVRARG